MLEEKVTGPDGEGPPNAKQSSPTVMMLKELGSNRGGSCRCGSVELCAYFGSF